MGKGSNSLATVELESETSLIVRDETEFLIPKSMREEMVRVLHMTHQANTAMMTQAKGKIFQPGMKGDLQRIYQDCPSMMCSLTGYKTTNKGTDEAVKCLRNWSSHYGMPYIAKSDEGLPR